MLSKIVKTWSLCFVALTAVMWTGSVKAEDFPFVCGTDGPRLQGFQMVTCDNCGSQKVHGVILFERDGQEPMNVSIFDSEDGGSWMVRGSAGTFWKRRYLLAKINKTDPANSFVDYQVTVGNRRPTMGSAWLPANCRYNNQ